MRDACRCTKDAIGARWLGKNQKQITFNVCLCCFWLEQRWERNGFLFTAARFEGTEAKSDSNRKLENKMWLYLCGLCPLSEPQCMMVFAQRHFRKDMSAQFMSIDFCVCIQTGNGNCYVHVQNATITTNYIFYFCVCGFFGHPASEAMLKKLSPGKRSYTIKWCHPANEATLQSAVTRKTKLRYNVLSPG